MVLDYFGSTENYLIFVGGYFDSDNSFVALECVVVEV